MPESRAGDGPRHKRPPLAKGLPILGNTVDALRDAAGFLVRTYHELGPVFRISRLGREAVVLAGADANAFFVANERDLFETRRVYAQMAAETGSQYNLAALDHQAHRHLRREVGLGFARQTIAERFPAILAHTTRTVQGWEPGTVFDVMEMTSSLLTAQAGLGMLNAAPSPDDARAIHSFCRTFVGVGADIQPKILLHAPGYRRSKRRFETLIDDVYRAHVRAPGPATPSDPRSLDLADVLLGARDEQGAPLPEADAKGSMYYPYVMSAVYTNRLCSYLLYELLRTPALMDRVRAEVDEVFAGAEVTLQALNRMPVLRAALKESLRFYPLFVGLPRHAVRDFEFQGYGVAKGEKVFIAVCVTHFLPEFFPHPLTFDVDRFLPPRDEHRQPNVLLPFGAGAHQCMGVSISDALSLTTIAVLLRHLELETTPPTYRARRTANPIPGPEGFKVRVVARRRDADRSRTRALEGEAQSLLRAGLDLDADTGALVAGRSVMRAFAPGQVIIHQGDEAQYFYVIADGEVDVVRQGGDEPPRPVARLSAGAYFGEIGLLRGVKRTATVVAAGNREVSVIMLDRESFKEIVAGSGLIAAELAALVQHRTRVLCLAKAFPALTAEQVARLAPRFVVERHERGELIAREGDQADALHVILSGKAAIVPGGWLGPSDHLGAREVVHRQPYRVTVTVHGGPLELLSLRGSELFELFADLPRAELARLIGAEERAS